MKSDRNRHSTGKTPSVGNVHTPTFLGRVVLGLVILNLLVICLSVIQLVKNRNTHIDAALIVAKNLTLSLEREISASFDQVDQALQEAAIEFNEKPELDRFYKNWWDSRLSQIRTRMPILSGLRATDASGAMIYGLESSSTTGVTVADRDYFIRLRDNKHAGLVISSPVKGRLSDKWVLLLARRLNQRDGSFGGVIVASIPLDYYRSIFASLKLDTKGSIGFRDGQMRLIVRYPEALGEAKEVGSTKIGDDFKAALQANPDFGSYSVDRTSIDGIQRLHYYRRNPIHNFYINVGSAYDDFLAEWRRFVFQTVILVGLLLLGSAAFARHLRQSLLQQQSVTEELQKSEEHYRALFSLAGDGICVISEKGTLIDLNEVFAQMHGYDKQEMLGMNIADLDTLGGLEQSPERAQAVLSGQTITFEVEHYHKNGSVFNLEVTASLMHSGLEKQFLCVHRDISERRKFEKALASSEHFLNAIIDTEPECIKLLDANCNLLMMNRAGLEMIEADSLEQVRGQCVCPLVTAPYKDAFCELTRQVFEGIPGKLQFEIVGLKNRRIWLETHAVPFRDDDGVIVSLLGITRDITEQKHAAEALFRAKAAAESANIAKTEFLANISHEIRTPMNGVIGNVQLLRFTDLTEEQERFLEYIETDAKSLVSVINDVLDISKIEAGKLELEQTPFSLRSCINDLIKPQEARIHAKGLVLATEIDATIPDTLCGDQLRLKQILRNLIGNALKFTEKGKIEVHVEMLEQAEDKARFQFSIIDSGIGIHPEALEKIFAPFSQADTSVTRKFGGTGLGLSICSRLAGLMDGTITVESKEGAGSTFRVTLPFLITEQPLVQQEALPPQVWERKPLRILLVDDSPTNRTMATKLLVRFGHDVTSSNDGTDALEQWRRSEFDIILMDIQMPVMDGIEATRLIREHEGKSGKHIPIIALTAHALQEQKNLLLSSGFDGYVSKPLDLAFLNAEMQRVMASSLGIHMPSQKS